MDTINIQVQDANVTDTIDVVVAEEQVDININSSQNVEVVNINVEDVVKGVDGLSAYQVAVNNGFVGTEQEWLDSLASEGASSDYLAYYILSKNT